MCEWSADRIPGEPPIIALPILLQIGLTRSTVRVMLTTRENITVLLKFIRRLNGTNRQSSLKLTTRENMTFLLKSVR